MMRKLRFPKISANVDEATITRWAKSEGDELEEGELLMEVTTDKGVVEVEAPCSGTLRQIVAPENSTLPVGYIVALIGAPDEPLPEVADANREILARHLDKTARDEQPTPRSRPQRTSKARATPSARKLAADAGVDLADIQAASPAKVLTDSIVKEYLEDKSPS